MTKKIILAVPLALALTSFNTAPSNAADLGGDNLPQEGLHIQKLQQIQNVDFTTKSFVEHTVSEVISSQEYDLSSSQQEKLNEIILSEVNQIEKEVNELRKLDNEIGTLALDLTSPTVVKYYTQNLKTANTIKANYDAYRKSEGIAFAAGYRDGMFISLVKSNGAWDLRVPLGRTTSYSFKDTKRTGEYIGNHHYGYMGKALGYANTTLKTAAGLYQIVSGTSDWKFFSSYFDDPADQAAIEAGITDYSNGYRFSNIIA